MAATTKASAKKLAPTAKASAKKAASPGQEAP